jgi:hypothetical protein
VGQILTSPAMISDLSDFDSLSDLLNAVINSNIVDKGDSPGGLKLNLKYDLIIIDGWDLKYC